MPPETIAITFRCTKLVEGDVLLRGAGASCFCVFVPVLCVPSIERCCETSSEEIGESSSGPPGESRRALDGTRLLARAGKKINNEKQRKTALARLWNFLATNENSKKHRKTVTAHQCRHPEHIHASMACNETQRPTTVLASLSFRPPAVVIHAVTGFA